ncbi:uncharacterized protein IAS62_005605 [Cryptococcus decagattii]|uniref:Uncharacterized protein n=1 Tax=Cryptococcus decagattii TaxID=1859122 RepID=A0ABZ2B457_9TREE
MSNHQLSSTLPQPSPITSSASLSLRPSAKSKLTMSSNTNTSPLKRSKPQSRCQGLERKKLSAASSLVKRSSMMMMGESGGDGSGDENVELKRMNDALFKTLAALRSRALELENSIDHGTSPELEKLTKEVFTLEGDAAKEIMRQNTPRARDKNNMSRTWRTS